MCVALPRRPPDARQSGGAVPGVQVIGKDPIKPAGVVEKPIHQEVDDFLCLFVAGFQGEHIRPGRGLVEQFHVQIFMSAEFGETMPHHQVLLADERKPGIGVELGDERDRYCTSLD